LAPSIFKSKLLGPKYSKLNIHSGSWESLIWNATLLKENFWGKMLFDDH